MRVRLVGEWSAGEGRIDRNVVYVAKGRSDVARRFAVKESIWGKWQAPHVATSGGRSSTASTASDSTVTVARDIHRVTNSKRVSRAAQTGTHKIALDLNDSLGQLGWPVLLSSSLRPTPPSSHPPMQAVVQPHFLTQYHLTAPSSPRTNTSVMPTPPVASRKRKRVHQFTVSYSEVQEVDNHGRVREVIVIDDTPPPPTAKSPATVYPPGYHPDYLPLPPSPIRTRARALAESQLLSALAAPAVPVASAPKKRKRDQADEPRGTITKKPAPGLQPQVSIPSTKSWASGSGLATTDVRNNLPAIINPRHLIHPRVHLHHQASNGVVPCDDKEGHYIIVPDDIIYNRCASSLLHPHSCHISSFQIAPYVSWVKGRLVKS